MLRFCAALSLLLSASLVCANRWVLTVQTAPDWMAGYVGDVIICTTFQVGTAVVSETGEIEYRNDTVPELSNECKTLPTRRFVRGKTYIFDLDFEQLVNTIEQVTVFGKPSSTSICKKKNKIDSWHVTEMSFHDMTTGRLFSVKQRMIIKTRCSKTDELLIENFNVSIQARPCSLQGLIHQSGSRFNEGCSGRCHCSDGSISCVSMCPPAIAHGCRSIYVPGQCCPVYICEDNPPNDIRTCSQYEEGDCEMAKRTVDSGEFPWTVFLKFCDRKGCRKFCSGALVDRWWVLTSADCLKSVSNITQDVRIIVGENTIALGENFEIELSVTNVSFSNAKQPSEQLALLKLKEPVDFDKTVQPVTLPKSREQCQILTRPHCAVSMIGWINVDVDNQQYDMYKLNVNLLDPSACESTSVSNSSRFNFRKRKPLPPSMSRGLCLDMANNELPSHGECGTCQTAENSTHLGCPSDKNWYLCTGEHGRPLIGKLPVQSISEELIEVNYLVGVIAYQLMVNETPTDICKKPAYKMAVSICNDLSWIDEVTQSYYYK